MAEFAMCADPTSDVFKNMASSRQTMVRRLEIILEFIKAEVSKKLERALFCSVILDEATDKERVELVVFLVRFVDNEEGKIQTKLLSIETIRASPNAENIFARLQDALNAMPQRPQEKNLVGVTGDGASVIQSTKNGFVGHCKRGLNKDLLATHCVAHRSVLMAKDAQHNIPRKVEETIKAILDFLNNSPRYV